MKTSILPVALFIVSTTVSGQESLGLIDVYERATVNDPSLREAEARYLSSAEVKRQARSSLLPRLSLSAGASDGHSLNPNPPLDFITGEPSTEFSSSESDSEGSNLGLSISQTIFNWSQILTLRQSDKRIAAAEINLAIAQQQLVIRVAEAYFRVLGAEDNLESNRAALEAFEQELEQATRRFDVGLIAITDVREVQAGRDRSAADVIAAERALATAFETLREIIDIYVTDLRTPIEELPLLTPDPNDVGDWVEVAQAQNLDLVVSRLQADIAEDQIQISRAERFPTLSLSASGSDSSSTATQTTNRFIGPSITTPPSSSDRESDSISLSFSLPIFNGGAMRSRVRQSVYDHRAQIETVERIARQTERLTRDTFLGVTSEISRVEALRQSLESQRLALLATQAGEEVGQRTGVDVVNAQNNVRSAETSYAAARYEYLLNILRLKQAAGTLSEEDLIQIDSWLE